MLCYFFPRHGWCGPEGRTGTIAAHHFHHATQIRMFLANIACYLLRPVTASRKSKDRNALLSSARGMIFVFFVLHTCVHEKGHSLPFRDRIHIEP